MANGNGEAKSQKTLNLVLPVSALGLLGTLMLIVAKDASIALDVARQHGQELLLIKGEINALREDMRDRTQKRYTSEDATRDNGYLQRQIDELKAEDKDHEREHKKG